MSLLEALDNKFWKNITNSAEGPLADLLPPSKTTLLSNRGDSYVLPQIRTERLNTVLLKGVFLILSNCQLNQVRLSLESLKTLFLIILYFDRILKASTH